MLFLEPPNPRLFFPGEPNDLLPLLPFGALNELPLPLFDGLPNDLLPLLWVEGFLSILFLEPPNPLFDGCDVLLFTEGCLSLRILFGSKCFLEMLSDLLSTVLTSSFFCITSLPEFILSSLKPLFSVLFGRIVPLPPLCSVPLSLRLLPKCPFFLLPPNPPLFPGVFPFLLFTVTCVELLWLPLKSPRFHLSLIPK